MTEIGKLFITAGLILLGLGLYFLYGPGFSGLGRLPGDIVIRKDNFSFYLPLTTCVLISALLSVILWLFKRF